MLDYQEILIYNKGTLSWHFNSRVRVGRDWKEVVGMVIAAFVLSIISLVLLIALTVIFLWVGAEVTKQDTIEKATREYLEQKDKTHND